MKIAILSGCLILLLLASSARAATDSDTARDRCVEVRQNHRAAEKEKRQARLDAYFKEIEAELAALDPKSEEKAVLDRRLSLTMQRDLNRRLLGMPVDDRPVREFVGAKPRDPEIAQYVSNWIKRIEAVGNANYPAEMKGVDATVQMTVAIRADGSVERVEINRGSRKPAVEKFATQVVTLAAPYQPFSSTMCYLDVLHITRTWNFGKPVRGTAPKSTAIPDQTTIGNHLVK